MWSTERIFTAIFVGVVILIIIYICYKSMKNK